MSDTILTTASRHSHSSASVEGNIAPPKCHTLYMAQTSPITYNVGDYGNHSPTYMYIMAMKEAHLRIIQNACTRMAFSYISCIYCHVSKTGTSFDQTHLIQG